MNEIEQDRISLLSGGCSTKEDCEKVCKDLISKKGVSCHCESQITYRLVMSDIENNVLKNQDVTTSQVKEIVRTILYDHLSKY